MSILGGEIRDCFWDTSVDLQPNLEAYKNILHFSSIMLRVFTHVAGSDAL
jgi:hypothetical protein